MHYTKIAYIYSRYIKNHMEQKIFWNDNKNMLLQINLMIFNIKV